MASFSSARQSHAAPAQQPSRTLTSLDMSRDTNGLGPDDPLQPLRLMAERVGKEVEKFAERVDHWHTHGNENARAKYQSTVKMVGKFRDVAETQVKELKRAHEQDNKMALERSVRRRIEHMAEAPDANAQSTFGQSIPGKASSKDINAGEPEKLRDLRDWQAELATWELVRIMIEQHHPEPGTDRAVEKYALLDKAGGNKRYSPNSEIWDRFLLGDDQAKEKAVILRWLEQTARNDRSDIESITTELEAQSGKGAHTWTSGWLDTKSKIKQAKRMEGTDQPLKPDVVTLKTADRTQNLVTQMDPDAPARQKRVLEKSDEFYERALWMVCYEMLRRGLPWKEICEWASERNETWRGVSVGAAHEAHSKGGPNVAGPTVGFLFRRMCLFAARGARNPYEGAVYSLLSGDLKQAQTQSVCQSWDDHLHAHYNALLLSRFDTYLLQNHPDRVTQTLTQKFVFQDAVAELGDWEHASKKVIGHLRQQKTTEALSASPIKLIQGALIAQTLDELILKVGTGLADMLQDDQRSVNLMLHPDSDLNDPSSKPMSDVRAYTAEEYYQTLAKDPHAFRILVHVFIVYAGGINTQLPSDEMAKWIAMDNVVTAYIEFLRISKRLQLIPLYAAQLQPERAAHCLARVLPDIKNSEEQRRTVALLEQYRIDVVEVVSQSFSFAFNNSGFIHFDDNGQTVITNPIKRFKIIESTDLPDIGLWPGYRIKLDFESIEVDPMEEGIIDALQWYHYVGNDYRQTFTHLKNALTIFLLNGRLGAADRVVADLSVESLSLSRTEALCGYPFDFTQEGAEVQDETALYEHRKNLTNVTRQTALAKDSVPNAEKHAAIVQRLLESSAPYYDLQQIVRILMYFRDWREAEGDLIKSRNNEHAKQVADPNATKSKADTSQLKEIVETIEVIFNSLMASISQSAHLHPEAETSDSWNLKSAYIPEIVLAYLSVLQTAAFFWQRDSGGSSAVKAMEVANLIADDKNLWLQKVFLETGRMSELVDALAQVGKAMLRLNEHEPKKSGTKKRGSRGETLRIWDLNARDRV